MAPLEPHRPSSGPVTRRGPEATRRLDDGLVESTMYPGTPEHQALLRAIAEQYADDDRVLAVSVFGSLGRGTWDQYSDLDLDVVTSMA